MSGVLPARSVALISSSVCPVSSLALRRRLTTSPCPSSDAIISAVCPAEST
eukprot:CAMPEP_0169440276 /NCGR_PEP_ID=MMETSP1042-20121227/7647_1 /TAXON_ID=464988 /ORGANISM="Hemiselmis andersenii, Strain CCMP1180" /LENGTH=50 /DNA_ID=CAMNT_0009551249 /DNA_START=95 /DNA_END=244 /DNA_ORIENTATION=-